MLNSLIAGYDFWEHIETTAETYGCSDTYGYHDAHDAFLKTFIPCVCCSALGLLLRVGVRGWG